MSPLSKKGHVGKTLSQQQQGLLLWASGKEGCAPLTPLIFKT